MAPPSTRRPNDRGFTLLEVLVAIVILSFGLLGMVGLQGASLKANREARYQASGVRLAAELGDLMRNNKAVSIDTSATNNPYLVDYRTIPALAAATPNCFTAPCATEKQAATADITDWLNRVNQELPGARVVVCFDASPYDASGLPQWACSNSGGVANVKIGWTRGVTGRATSDAASFELASVDTTHPAVVLPVVVGN